MKRAAFALLAMLSPIAAPASPPPGAHVQPAPAPEPMKQFAWRDEAAGYTFIGPQRWAGKVRAEPLASRALAASGATSGVRFVSGNTTLLVLLAAEDERALALGRDGRREVSRHGGHVVAASQQAHAGELALTDDELANAVQWDGMAPHEAVR
jgi:hypothetical protein